MLCNLIQLETIILCRRYDPEYYINQVINGQNEVVLSDISFITDGEHGSPQWDEKSNITYITAESVGECYLKDIDFKHISKKQADRNKRSHVLHNDILFYSVGAYCGKAALAEKHLFPANIPRSVAIIRIQDNSFLPEYVCFFLNSFLGQTQTTSLKCGNSQPMIALENIKKIKVKHISFSLQQRFSDYYQKAYNIRLLSSTLYQKAMLIFEESSGNSNSLSGQHYFYAHSLYVEQSKRLDPEFWRPSIANKQEQQKLINFLQPITIATTIHHDSYYNYIEIGDIDVGSGDVAWTNRLGANLPANAKISVSGGELIISKVRPTRGAIAIIPDGFDGICSSAFVVGKIESPYREVIQVFLRSNYGKMLLGRPQKGSSYPTITDKEVLDIEIPILETNKMNEISVLVQQSHRLRRESKRLLEVAKKAVEIAIEESEETAMQYLNENQTTSIEY